MFWNGSFRQWFSPEDSACWPGGSCVHAVVPSFVVSHAILYPERRNREGFCHVVFDTPAGLHLYVHSHVSSIFLIKLCRVGFHSAAATLSLSASCLLTSSAVECVPSLILTSTRNLGGSDSSSRTRTPKPITVAKLQC